MYITKYIHTSALQDARFCTRGKISDESGSGLAGTGTSDLLNVVAMNHLASAIVHNHKELA